MVIVLLVRGMVGNIGGNKEAILAGCSNKNSYVVRNPASTDGIDDRNRLELSQTVEIRRDWLVS